MDAYRLLLIWALRIAAVLWLVVGVLQSYQTIMSTLDPIYRGPGSELAIINEISTAIIPSMLLAAVAEMLALSRRKT